MQFQSESQKIFYDRLIQHFGFKPTRGQERMYYAFTRLMFSAKTRCALTIKGYAGTGKTTGVKAMVATLYEHGFQCVLLAPTGRAAKVLSNYTGHAAYTIHKHIYQRVAGPNGQLWFELRDNEATDTVYFIDEASMISDASGLAGGENTSGDLLEDLLRHVFSGTNSRIVFIGDNAQLPPVGMTESPALQTELMGARYFLNIAEVALDQVMRQKEESGILYNATRIREQMLGQSANTWPRIEIQNFADIALIYEGLQEEVEQAFQQFGQEETIIITKSNKRSNLFNQQVRQQILWHEEEINQSDRMMVIRNNYYWLTQGQERFNAAFIANGDVIKIARVKSFEDRGAFRFCKAEITLVDYPEIPEREVILLCTTIWEESAGLSQDKMRDLAQIIALDYPDITNARELKKAVYSDPYYNALHVKFAYAITCHKAQGGQWPAVFIDHGYLSEEMQGLEFSRWLYTAFTRAQSKAFLIGFDEQLLAK
jgi:ATP-dependent exoDNAse (exonuclease V) alpha subunit